MPNQVFLDQDGFIHNIYQGDQTRESVEAVVNKNNQLVAKLRQQNRPVLVLADLTQLGQSSLGSRQASAEALKNEDFDKVALFGANIFMKHVGNFIITASGQDQRAKMFNTKDEAIGWLKKNAK
ncbi:STAS/SEC14 domain-containing protein [Candidatus Curtissbacteria bacterium]|nr:STAS/SEC14 domain-containing protein [Candidatus Curtissbacteria bacterium]